MSAMSAAPDEDALWLATFSLRDIQRLEMRMSEHFSGTGSTPDSALETIVRSFVLQAIVDWETLEARLSAVGDLDRKLSATETRERLDDLIANDLSQLKLSARALEMGSDRLGALWQDRLTPVREALQDSVKSANSAAVTGIFRLPRSRPISAPETAIFRKK
jgi:hypothetical protein